MNKILFTLLAVCFFATNTIAQDGSNDPTFNTFDDCTFGDGTGFEDHIYSTTIQADGKIIVGGKFDSYNGTDRNRIARLNADGSLDVTFNPWAGVNNTVYATAVQADGKIIVGGNFGNRIARLNADGSLDATFNPGTGFNSQVTSISIQSDGKIIVGGWFNYFNGIIRNRITRLNADGSLDINFNIGTGFNQNVNTIAVQTDGKIMVGGWFTGYNGTTRNNLARLNTDGTLDTTFNSGTSFWEGISGPVFTIAIQTDGKIIIGGSFVIIEFTTTGRIARLHADGTLDFTFNTGSGFSSAVQSTSLQIDGKIIVGGLFTSFNGVPRNHIVRLNTNGSLDATFNSGTAFNHDVYATAVLADGRIIAGGWFTSYNGSESDYIACLNANGSIDTNFNINPGFNDTVLSTVIQTDGKILVGGEFYNINGTIRNHIARLNADGSLDDSFNPGSGFDDYVHSIAIQADGKIIVGGEFNSFNGIATNRLSRLHVDGSLDTTFNIGAGFSGSVWATVIQTDGKIIVGGWFTDFDGTTQNRITRLNTDGSLDDTFNPGTGFNNSVRSIVVQADGKIIVGGTFTTYNGIPRNRITRLNLDGSLDNTFNLGNGFNDPVYSIALQADGKIIVGGVFSYYSGSLRNGLARLNADGTIDESFSLGTSFYSGFNGSVNSTTIQSDGKIIVGGSFTLYYNISRKRIARVNADGSLDTTFNPGTGFSNSPPTGSVYTTALQGDGKIIVGGWFTFYNDNCRNKIARLLNCLPATGTDIQTACDSYTWIDGNIYSTNNNSATFSILGGAANGCDSLVTLNLTINNTPENTVSMTGITLTADETDAIYQWLDCDDGYAPISGETSQTFTPEANGNYAVVITKDGCTNTSACTEVISVSTNEYKLSKTSIYPNPTSGNFTIVTDLIGKHYNITDYLGKMITQGTINQTQMDLDLSNAINGVYLIQIEEYVYKLIKH
jgi:uncharacterized delta-60 repeat protein